MNIWLNRFSFFTAGLMSMLLFISYSKPETKAGVKATQTLPQNIRSVPFRKDIASLMNQCLFRILMSKNDWIVSFW
jgi:hypothetical protein